MARSSARLGCWVIFTIIAASTFIQAMQASQLLYAFLAFVFVILGVVRMHEKEEVVSGAVVQLSREDLVQLLLQLALMCLTLPNIFLGKTAVNRELAFLLTAWLGYRAYEIYDNAKR